MFGTESAYPLFMPLNASREDIQRALVGDLPEVIPQGSSKRKQVEIDLTKSKPEMKTITKKDWSSSVEPQKKTSTSRKRRKT